jgi:uncharacterized Fe-S cluster-containing radical SAM superfamily protein
MTIASRAARTAKPKADPALDGRKFRNPGMTADGAPRAAVDFQGLDVLWINTGSLCNLACGHCYIESSPANDRLAYITAAEVAAYFDEIEARGLPTAEIGFTGGEPFLNPEFTAMLEDALARGFQVLVLTNAMKPMLHKRAALLDLRRRFGDRLGLRVSIDHYGQALHELERGPRSWAPMLEGLRFLAEHDFAVSVAGRTCWPESEAALRAGFARLFEDAGLAINAADPHTLLLLPEMDETLDVPEITAACWSILGKQPRDMMCAGSRMVVKRKGADRPAVVACTLLPYDEAFELGHSLAEAEGPIALNHPHCARFCVLGGGSCSG